MCGCSYLFKAFCIKSFGIHKRAGNFGLQPFKEKLRSLYDALQYLQRHDECDGMPGEYSSKNRGGFGSKSA